MTRVLRGLLAIGVLAAILVGAPWLLWQLMQMPGFLPEGFQFSRILTTPDDGRLFLLLVWAFAWLLWAGMVVLILVELAAALRGVQAPRLPAASLPQGWIRGLVVAALALFMAAPLHATASPGDSVGTPAAPSPSVAGIAHAVGPMTAVAPQGDVAKEQPFDAEAPVTVERGDTLWDLAEEHLGDPLRWPELYEHNKGIPQPDGARLQNPDVIHVGWSIGMPRTEPSQPEPLAPSPAPSASAREALAEEGPAQQPQHGAVEEEDPAATGEEPVPATEPPTATEVKPAGPRTSQPQQAETSSGPEDLGEAGEELDEELGEELVAQWWHVSGLLGSGLLLGAGVAAALLRRRREQFRMRKPGRVIAEPPAAVAPIERTAQLASGLVARQVARLDQVLRRLGPDRWPSVEAVAMARDATITLRSLEPMPAPWEQGEDGWVLPNHVPLAAVGDSQVDQPCPYPLLVTIGADVEDRVWLVNLAAVGILQVAGDPVMRADLLRYVAAELAVNPWSDDVRVACDGIATEVIPMAPERLDADIDEVTAIARANAQRSTDVNSDAVQGRARQLGDEAWGAAAVLADVELDQVEELARLIVDKPEGTGTALVTAAQRGALTVTSDGRVQGFGLDLTAVGLTEDEAAGCAALLATTETADQPEPPPVDDYVDATGNLRPEHRLNRDDALEAAEPLLSAPDDDYLRVAVVDQDDLDSLAPRLTPSVALTLQDRDPDLDGQVEQWFADVAPLPRLSLLGPVTARCLGKPIAKQKGYFTELLAYLALRPNGVTIDQVMEAFSITADRARTVVSRCRQWVGHHPVTNEPFIPDARATAQAKTRGVGIYLLDQCLVDADLFRRLRARGVARGAAGIEDLELALSLVSGRPFDQLRPGGWNWLLQGDRIDQHMVCAIGDVAHVVVTHHRQQGNLEGARWAAKVGLLADPDSETARLDLAGIMAEEGNADAARRVLADALGDQAELDLTDRGAAIAQSKGWLEVG